MEQIFTMIGKIDTIMPPKSFEGKESTITTRLIWIETGEKHKEYSEFTLSGKSVEKAESLHIGDEVWIKFKVGGRKWESKEGDIKLFPKLNAISFGLIQSNQEDEIVVTPEEPKKQKKSSPVEDREWTVSDQDLPF